jgi:hypothetical protein
LGLITREESLNKSGCKRGWSKALNVLNHMFGSR